MGAIRGTLWAAVVPVVLVVCLVTACGGRTPPAYWPTDGWRSTTPEEQGMDSEKLAQMAEYLQQGSVELHSLLIVRHGYLVSELYVYPYSAEQPHFVMSTTKSVVDMLVGIAIQKGYLKNVHQSLFEVLPSDGVANLDERKKAITLQDLLTMTSGLDDPGDTAVSAMMASKDPVRFMLDLPMAAQPGSTFNYSTGSTEILSAVIQKATGRSAREFANKELFAPLGIAELSEARWPSDAQGVTLGGFGLTLTPQEMAKLGYLYLNQGRWDGAVIVPADWVAASTAGHANKGGDKEYGYLWWVDPQGRWYATLGRSGEHIFVYPAEDLVVVFTAGLPTGNNADLTPLQGLLDDYILPAVKSGRSLPADASAQARLLAATQALARPPSAAPEPLPAVAARVSGKVYALGDNPFGWHSISFSFPVASDEVLITIDGQQLTLGLDDVYRVAPGADSVFPQELRAHWENPITLAVDDQTLGQMLQYTYQIQFAGDAIYIKQTDKYSGSTFEVRGVLVPAAK